MECSVTISLLMRKRDAALQLQTQTELCMPSTGTQRASGPGREACRASTTSSALQKTGTHGGVGMGMGIRNGNRPPPPELLCREKKSKSMLHAHASASMRSLKPS